MSYQLSQPLGNSVFSYDQRKQLGSDCTLVISDPCEISSLDQVQLGDFVVFEEAEHLNPPGDQGESLQGQGRGTACGGGFEGVFGEHKKNGGLQSCTGLAHTYILSLSPVGGGPGSLVPLDGRGLPTIIITDNHNHVFPYWLDFLSAYVPLVKGGIKGGFGKQISLIHIDQHSDLGSNTNKLDLTQLSKYPLEKGGGCKPGDYIRNFAHLDCNIGNFITPCIESGLITNMIQVRTQYKLNEIINLGPLTSHLSPLIVDIDLDFWAPEMGISDIAKTMSQVRTIMDQADLITIATSPYFIDQNLALELLHQLLEPWFQSQEEIEISERGS